MNIYQSSEQSLLFLWFNKSMKLFIISDIHGSDLYLEQALKYYDDSFDHLIILGDILYHGPRNDLPEGYAPKKVIERLNNLKDKIIAVRGNCEAEVDQMVLNFDCMETYKELEVDGLKLFITHGHKYNEQSLPEKENFILLHGHTHIPACNEHKTFTYINPGSISIPKENSPHSFMIYEDREFKWQDIEGHIYKTCKI